jgi:hypothetical protein
MLCRTGWRKGARHGKQRDFASLAVALAGNIRKTVRVEFLKVDGWQFIARFDRHFTLPLAALNGINQCLVLLNMRADKIDYNNKRLLE